MPGTDADAPRPADETGGMLAAAIRVVSGLTLLSRLSGLVRDVLTARLLGDSAAASAFKAAYALPNFFRRLFGEGALSAAFIPEFTRARREDPKAADALASLILYLLALVTGALTLLIELALLARLMLFPASDDTAFSIRMVLLMLPMMPMVCLAAILGGMHQVLGRFAIPAAGPIVLNLFQIGAAGVFWLLTRDNEGPHHTQSAATVIGAAALVASVVQVVWSFVALRGRILWTRAFSAARERARTVLKRFLPVVLGLGTLQLNTMMDTVIAMWPQWIGPTMLGRPVPLDDRSNAILGYTQTLYQFPLGVFGIAVATAVFPLLARFADDAERFRSTLRRGVRLSLFIALPATLGLILTRHDLLFVIFGSTSTPEPGEASTGFSAEGVARAAAVLQGFAVGIVAYSLNHCLTRAFYARGDTLTPMRIAMAAVALNLTLNFTLIWPLKEAGLAWATAISASAQTLALLVFARTRLNLVTFDRETLFACIRLALTAVIMSSAVFALLWFWPETHSWLGRALRLTACVVVGGVIYMAAAFLLRCPELRWLMERPKGPRGDMGSMTFE